MDLDHSLMGKYLSASKWLTRGKDLSYPWSLVGRSPLTDVVSFGNGNPECFDP
jgi:hypothetical protein